MVVIGIDVGGTSIKGGYVTLEGKILSKFSLPIDKKLNGIQTVNALADLINKYISENEIKKEEIIGIGIGCPGAIDSNKGIIDYSNNLCWDNIPIAEIIRNKTGLDVKITNDANAATLGEAIFGAGKLYNSIIMLTLGTGVGGGIVLNKKLYEGNDGKGAELGHATIVVDGELCTCGRRGCLEAYASATAVIRDAKRAVEINKDSLILKMVEGDVSKIGARTVFEANFAGDKTAKEIVDKYIKYLGEGILNYCNIFRPDAIVLSGGIANTGKYLIDRLTNYCAERNYGFNRTPSVKILNGVLGYDSGLIGAAALQINK